MSRQDSEGERDRRQPVALQGRPQRLSIHFGETAQYHHHPLYIAIVRGAHAHGMAGETVPRGIEGLGTSNHIHTTRPLTLPRDLPLVEVIVDSRERISQFLPELGSTVGDDLVVVEEVEIVLHSGRKPAEPRP